MKLISVGFLKLSEITFSSLVFFLKNKKEHITPKTLRFMKPYFILKTSDVRTSKTKESCIVLNIDDDHYSWLGETSSDFL